MDKSFSYADVVIRFYDVVYKDLRTIDREFYLNMIQDCQGPVLEVGVGTGRLFCTALEQGADIHGLEISPAMLDMLRSKLPEKEHHRLHPGDIREYNTGQKFQLVIAPFRVFSHLHEIEDQLAALNNIREQLLPGGRLVFDVFVPNPSRINTPVENQLEFEGEWEPGKFLKRFADIEPEYHRQRSKIKFRFEWEEHDKLQKASWEFFMRYYFRYELEHLVERSGLVLEKICGDFKEGALVGDSKDFVVFCRKK